MGATIAGFGHDNIRTFMLMVICSDIYDFLRYL